MEQRKKLFLPEKYKEFVELNELLKIEIFNKTIDLNNEFKFNLSSPVNNFEWGIISINSNNLIILNIVN